MSEPPVVDGDPNPERLTFLPIDPFAAHRHVASRIAGLGGEHPGDRPGYAFQSLDVYPVLGPVRFTLHFHGLTATAGTLTIRIHACSRYPGTAPQLLRTVDVPLGRLADDGGIVAIELISRRNMGYTIGGTVDDDTDARADALSLSLDPRERAVPSPDDGTAKAGIDIPAVRRIEGWREKPELATIRPVLFARPVSQAMTAAQLADPLVDAWNAVLHQSDGDAIRCWEDAFILQALHYYGIASDAGAGLGLGRRKGRLPAWFAGRGCTILTAAVHRDDLPDGDPGLGLERLLYPDLCSPRRFYEAVHLTLFDGLAVPGALTGFDFLWSTDVFDAPDARARFPQLLRDAMRCLRIGGVAIHMLRYATGDPAAPATGYSRAEIERMALSLIADGQEVAQLNFAIDRQQPHGDAQIPFALVARRIR